MKSRIYVGIFFRFAFLQQHVNVQVQGQLNHNGHFYCIIIHKQRVVGIIKICCEFISSTVALTVQKEQIYKLNLLDEANNFVGQSEYRLTAR